jgi:transcription initiation factor TFIIIB Brf1 subunit/transcription initiation factor TFIIB
MKASELQAELSSSQRFFSKPRIRICPQCQTDEYFHEDEQACELVCQKCGSVLSKLLPSNDPGEDFSSKSAAPSLDLRKGLGRPPDDRTLLTLMRTNQIGNRGLHDVSLRLPILRRAADGTDCSAELFEPAVRHASAKLEQLGWKQKKGVVAGNSESEFNQISGGTVGTYIRKYLSVLLDDLQALGHVNGNGGRRPVSFDHQFIAENAIAAALLSEDSDKRRLQHALGFRLDPKTKEWRFRKSVPRLELYDPEFAASMKRIVENHRF